MRIKNEELKLMNEIILKAENIFKSFQTTKKVKLDVLKGISLEIEKEKITIIVGASGAGKSHSSPFARRIRQTRFW